MKNENLITSSRRLFFMNGDAAILPPLDDVGFTGFARGVGGFPLRHFIAVDKYLTINHGHTLHLYIRIDRAGGV